MIKNISPARREYEEVYRDMRLHGGVKYWTDKYLQVNDARDCAILSYDYHDSHFSGWINRQRMHIFQTKALYRPEWDGLPF